MLKQYNNGYITEYQFRPPEIDRWGHVYYHEPVSISIAIASAAASAAAVAASAIAASAAAVGSAVGIGGTAAGTSSGIGMGTVLGAAGAGVGIYGQLQAGRAAEQQGRAQAKLYEYNARLQEAEGRARMKAAEQEEQKISGQQKRFLGYQKAAFAKSGFSIEEGSSVDVMANTWGEFAKDRLLTLRNGMLEQMSLNSSRAKGSMAITRGQNYKRASYLGAVGTGLGFGSQLNWGGNKGLKTGTLSSNMSYVDKWMDN